MNFSTINLKLENNKGLNLKDKNLEFLILNEYDGVKELINKDEHILLSWIDETDDYEEWILLKLDKDRVNQYLEGKISLLKLILKNEIFITKRYFDNYSEFKDITKTSLDKIKDGLPIENISLI